MAATIAPVINLPPQGVPSALPTPPIIAGAPTTPVAATPGAAGVANPASYPMASLYVGDLHPEVTEAQLFEKFCTAGPVLSIRVCRDAITRRSLGYAYVNFQNPADAERALDTMNFDLMQNKPIRIMWSQRDPAIRRSGAGNIFIKNLDKRIDTKSMYDTFSLFGTILSCKIATDEEGHNRGYGFIHFASEDAAQQAVERVNGMLLDGKKVYVGKFQPREARMKEIGENDRRYINVYVKNFGEELDDEGLKKLFEEFGEISSSIVVKDEEGKSKGFGFVAFKTPESGRAAVEKLNGYELPESKQKIYVGPSQKKCERQAELKRKFEAQKAEKLQRYQGVNLYIKNLDDTVTDESLRAQFETYGKITSAKVMCDDEGRSKGFGFVCFDKPDDATKAVVEMNNKMVGTKPLYVALAQRKEVRKAQLASQYMQRLANMRLQNPSNLAGTMYAPTQGGYFVSSGMARPQFVGPMRNQMPTPTPRWNNVPGQQPVANMQNFAMPNGQYAQPQRGRPRPPRFQNGQRPTRMPAQQNQPNGARPNPQARTGLQQMYQNYNAGVPQQVRQTSANAEPLSTHTLAQASDAEQKQILGERLFPLISRHSGGEDVGKITGMMLKMDNSELLMLLDNEQALKGKVEEASSMLRNAQKEPQQA